MTDYDSSVYYHPERHGLEVFGEIEWSSGGYDFDTTVVWRHLETGKLYIAHDSGCSCPLPFEDIASVYEMEEVTPEGAARQIETRRAEMVRDYEWAYGDESARRLWRALRTYKGERT